MSLEEKLKFVRKHRNEFGGDMKDWLNSCDNSGKLVILYNKSRYAIAVDEMDNPKILLIGLLYKILKDKE